MNNATTTQLVALTEGLIVPDDGWTYGIRVVSDELSVGDELDASRVWIENEPTDAELPGTSVLDIGCLGSVRCDYPGRHVYLVRGEDEGWGEDVGERILSGCVVVAQLA